jgi:hypothetical protein
MQIIKSYIKSKFDWWKVLFFHSIDIMIVNAFIVFQEFKKENPQKFDNLPVHFGQFLKRLSIILKIWKYTGFNATKINRYFTF